MNLKEMFICAKTRDQGANEDGLVMTDEFVAVIDGVSAKNDTRWDGMKPGCYAKEILTEQLYCTTIRNKSPEKFFTELDNVIARAVKRMDPDMDTNDRPKASVLIFNGITDEIWLYGDSQYMVNGKLFPPDKKIDRLTSAVRSFVLEDALKRGVTAEDIRAKDEGREAILPLLRMQASFENEESYWGYPVLNGRGIAPDMIKVLKVDKGDIVVLATDGYPELKATLEESEERLRELLEEDPLCMHSLRTTKCLGEDFLSFDDRTYVRLEV